MNLFACYLAISCCNKFSIFFVFIRELSQNVRCHRFGGRCSYYYSSLCIKYLLSSIIRNEKTHKMKIIVLLQTILTADAFL